MKAIRRDGATYEVEQPQERLEILRHSTSHLMALAVIELYGGVRLGIGPPTAEGFYYDFQVPHRFVEADLEKVEAKMKCLQKQGLCFEPSIVSQKEAIDFFRLRGEELKAELVEERGGEVLSQYKLGKLVDFCTGPHVICTDQLQVFKLLSVAGSYWKGDEKREQLQRIYGTAFFTEAELQDFLATQEEARRRDHRRLGRELDLFSVQDSVAPGIIFWHPRGAKVRALAEEFVRQQLEAWGYQFVYTPQIAKSDLWKTSGHYDFFRQHMYTLPVDEEEYVLKPMNCPGHILIYQSAKRSYRDLPIRLAEFGTVHRYEKSGTLHGMLRVRGFTQDDAHIFCRPAQVLGEVLQTLDLGEHILKSFGFDRFQVNLSAWDEDQSDHYAGTRQDWEKAESVLVQALDQKGWSYTRQEGQAAFYGPKIDIELIDALGRAWQLSTFQFDFNLPARFGVTYVGSDSKDHQVVMIHRALLGSMERFMGILVEHYAGAFPIWLSPLQAMIIPISEKHHAYAGEVKTRLQTLSLRVDADLRNEKVGYKIREAQLLKIPYMLVVGDREMADEGIAVRNRFDGDLGPSSIEDFARRVKDYADRRVSRP